MNRQAALNKAIELEGEVRRKDLSMGNTYQETAARIINGIKDHNGPLNLQELLVN